MEATPGGMTIGVVRGTPGAAQPVCMNLPSSSRPVTKSTVVTAAAAVVGNGLVGKESLSWYRVLAYDVPWTYRLWRLNPDAAGAS